VTVPILLQRVDERLIHGQVVIGWGAKLRPERFIIIDDELVESQWEQELYALGAGDAEVVFCTVDEAREQIAAWRADDRRSILLTRDIRAIVRLAAGGGLEGSEVNLGGIHHGPERREVLTYLHLSPADEEDLRTLEAEGVRVTARDLPGAHAVDLRGLIG